MADWLDVGARPESDVFNNDMVGAVHRATAPVHGATARVQILQDTWQLRKPGWVSLSVLFEYPGYWQAPCLVLACWLTVCGFNSMQRELVLD